MEISFYIDAVHYHGTAVPYERPGNPETIFVVRLEDKDLPVFHVSKNALGEWISEDLPSAELINAVGNEIGKTYAEEMPDAKITTNGEITKDVTDTVTGEPENPFKF